MSWAVENWNDMKKENLSFKQDNFIFCNNKIFGVICHIGSELQKVFWEKNIMEGVLSGQKLK